MLGTQQLQLADSLTILRLSLHVFAATIWVGGQFVILGLLAMGGPLVKARPKRSLGPLVRLSWPAFWLLVVTGVWNYLAINHANAASSWNAVFGIKMLCVVIAGLGTFLHTKAKDPKRRGMFAGIGALGSILALVLGVALAG